MKRQVVFGESLVDLSRIVDFDDPSNNLFGCSSCPTCGSKDRAAYRAGKFAAKVVCRDCGLLEDAIFTESDDSNLHKYAEDP